MSPLFRKKTIVTQETLGELLRKVRLGKKWNLQTAASKTKIAGRHLLALEKSLYDEMPGEIYIKNFIKVYSKKLGLDPQKCLNKYNQEKHIIEEKKHQRSLKEIDKIKLLHRLLKPHTIKINLVCLIAVIVLSYIAFNIYQTMAPPFLEIYYPQDNLETNQLIIAIQGKSKKEATVFINNQEIIVNEDGSFEKVVTLKEGINTITIKAETKHSLANKILRNILVTKDAVAQNF